MTEGVTHGPTGKGFWTTLPGVIAAVAGLVTAVGGTVGTLYATGVIGGDSAAAGAVGTPPVTAGDVVGGGSGFPSELEQKLLSWVPPATRDSCVRATAYPQGAVARLSCASKGVREVRYSLFPSGEAMYGHYNRRLSHFAAPGDSCASGQDHEWAFADRDTMGKTGRVHCWVDSDTGTAWIEWTADWVNIYAYASRPDGNAKALFGWFGRSAGPVNPSS